MRILGIETSCDETAIAVLECDGKLPANIRVLGNALLSQIDIHQEYGGVFPALAKREHAKNLIPLLQGALSEAELLHEDTQTFSNGIETAVGELLAREGDLAVELLEFLKECEVPDVDTIAVTAGPGLEPALWVGVSFAKALALCWNKPLVAVNHMEGHLLSALLMEKEARTYVLPETAQPLLGLLISGGHTELVLMEDWLSYQLIGATRDDAVGEAFDKVARMLGLPYPGGPEISKLAERARERGGENPYTLPRPMLNDPACDFSFSGLKTAVLYLVKDKELTEANREDVALAFEDAAADVLYAKTLRALTETGARTLAIGGGVSANTHIKRTFRERLAEDRPDVTLCIPPAFLTSDNAIMIALAGYYHARAEDFADVATLRADGNLALAQVSK